MKSEINQLIDERIHPITGIKEDFKSMAYKRNKTARHYYDYELDITL